MTAVYKAKSEFVTERPKICSAWSYVNGQLGRFVKRNAYILPSCEKEGCHKTGYCAAKSEFVTERPKICSA